MKNHHTLIAAHGELDQDALNLMNKIRLHAQILEELVQEVKLHVAGQRAGARELYLPAEREAELARLDRAEPERWAALARTRTQEALMLLSRAVAQPTLF